jgi:hypothetical protein
MSGDQSPQATRWQVWLVGLGDYLRAPAGAIRLFTSIDEAKQAAQEAGGIVQVEGAPALGGFDRALT